MRFLKEYFGSLHVYPFGLNKDKNKLLVKLLKDYPYFLQNNIDLALVLTKARDTCIIDAIPKYLAKKTGCYCVKSGHTLFVTNKKDMISQIKQLSKGQMSGNKDQIKGSILGYPKCCIKSYIKRIDKFFKTGELDDIKKAKGFDRFLSYIKCKDNCKASKRLAKKYAVAIKIYCPNFYLHKLGFWFCLTHLKEI